MTIFQEIECRTIKMDVTFSVGNGVPNMALKFFPQKRPYWLNDSQKTSFGEHFLHISGSIGAKVSKKKIKNKNRVPLCVDSHQPCEFQENRFKTATCIVNNYYKLKTRSVIF